MDRDEWLATQLFGGQPVITPEVWAEYLSTATEPEIAKAQQLLHSGKFRIETAEENNE